MVRAEQVRGMEDVRGDWARGVELLLREDWLRQRAMTTVDAIKTLKALFEPVAGGSCGVRVRYQRTDAEVLLQFGDAWRIRPNDTFVRQVQRLFGTDALTFRLRRPAAEADGRAVDYAQSG